LKRFIGNQLLISLN